MEDNYEEKSKKVKLHAFFICLCFFIFGSIIGTFFFFLYPNDILCDYTNNKYLCNEKICNKGFFGLDCLECKICVNGICDGSGTKKGTGKCVCNEGWSGKLCNDCDKGFYGSNCSKCDNCKNGLCDGSNTKFGTGKCKCFQPYIGDNCDNCLDNYYGVNCSKKCTNLLCLNSKCNDDGTCKECQNGYEGINCNKCNKFYISVNNKCILNTNLTEICKLPEYGYSITDTKFGECQECPKDNNGLICSGNGNCNGIGTVFGDGSCNCNGNFTGKICQYQGNSVNINLCQKSCNNNGLCLLYNNEYSCSCFNNYTGVKCNDCSVGYIKENSKCIKCYRGSTYFGQYCQKCSCDNGLCDDGIFGIGTCTCFPGFIGTNCDKCLDNYYGNNCIKCSECNNKGICHDGKLGNGECICNFGYTGNNCNECSNGFIKNNLYCDECPGSYGGKQNECFGNGVCFVKNNQANCRCKEGFKGRSCSELVIGNCSNYDYCNFNGECIDNECYCKNNLYGDYCNETYKSYLMKTNSSVYFFSSEPYDVVKNDIEKIEKNSSMNTGDALGISIISVFLFIGCFVGTAWFIKNKPNPIKNYATRLTASKKIELTPEELKYSTINPILNISDSNNIFIKSMKNITIATEKDHDHEFEDAIKYYNLGIDQIMNYMKQIPNANERFQIAKKINIYLERVKYLNSIIQNRELINEIQSSPLAPVVNEKKIEKNSNK